MLWDAKDQERVSIFHIYILATQCRMLTRMGYVHISVSELIHREIKKGFHLGAQLEEDMRWGREVNLVHFLVTNGNRTW